MRRRKIYEPKKVFGKTVWPKLPGKMKKEKPVCGGCQQRIKKGEPCYQVRSGYIGKDSKFVRKDRGGQLFHPGRCMNSEEDY
ncbi:hypothetical protein ES705_26166 [subsurface metagenome]